MPEEYEEQEVTETTVVETDSTVEAKEENRVPVSVVKELRDELRQAKEDGNITRAQLTQLMSEYQNAIKQNRPMEEQPDLDPEVLKLLKPYLQPVLQEMEMTKSELKAIKDKTQQSEAESYIERNIPNLNEIREEILKEIQSYSPSEQKEILANPREIVRIGKTINKLKGVTTSSKAESRSRARTETGSTATRTDADSSVDAKVQAWMKANNL